MIDEFEQQDGGVTDEALMGLVGSAFDEGRRGRDAQAVLARGRQLRRRKRAIPTLGALAVVAVSTTLAVALNGPSGAAGATAAGSGHTPADNGTTVNMDNAAFSVHTDAKTGRVTITLRQFEDVDELEQLLAKAGIRSYFHSFTVQPLPDGSVPMAGCKPLGVTALDPSDLTAVLYPTPAAPKNSFTVDPSKMPKGSVLGISFAYIGHVGGTAEVSMGLLSGEPTGCEPTTVN